MDLGVTEGTREVVRYSPQGKMTLETESHPLALKKAALKVNTAYIIIHTLGDVTGH